ncbi:GAF domain-containing protein [Lentzea sp. NPDC102401]|uniref:GAF domain-containing protein n=1 Tax=Lentzea sp. NPDC102401 TaxID=3364128 RepID=UPI00381EB073
MRDHSHSAGADIDWRQRLSFLVMHWHPLRDPANLVRELVECARLSADAATAALTVPAEQEGWLRIAVAAGGLREWEDRLLPMEGSVSALTVDAGRAILIDDVVLDEQTEQAARSSDVGPAVAGPVIADGELRGVLMIGRPPGSRRFTDSDREMVDAVVGHLGWALLAQSHADSAEQWDLTTAVYRKLAGRLFQLTADLCSLRPLVPQAAAMKIDRIITDSDDIAGHARDIACEWGSVPHRSTSARSRVLSAFQAALSSCELVGSARFDRSTGLDPSSRALDVVERWIPIAVAIAARYGLARSVSLDIRRQDSTIEAKLRYRGWPATSADLAPAQELGSEQEVETPSGHAGSPGDEVVLRLALSQFVSPEPTHTTHGREDS